MSKQDKTPTGPSKARKMQPGELNKNGKPFGPMKQTFVGSTPETIELTKIYTIEGVVVKRRQS